MIFWYNKITVSGYGGALAAKEQQTNIALTKAHMKHPPLIVGFLFFVILLSFIIDSVDNFVNKGE